MSLGNTLITFTVGFYVSAYLYKFLCKDISVHVRVYITYCVYYMHVCYTFIPRRTLHTCVHVHVLKRKLRSRGQSGGGYSITSHYYTVDSAFPISPLQHKK